MSGRISGIKKLLSRLGRMPRRALDGLRLALYPEDITCDCCGAELTADTRYRLCAECSHNFERIDGKICLTCGAPVLNEADYCIRCQNSESLLDCNRAPAVYEGIAKKLIYDLKFGKKKYIADSMSAMMADCFLSYGMHADVIVPVPMTEREMKERGFNQSLLLAERIGERLGLPVLPALIKVRETAPQKRLGGRERKDNVRDAFRCIVKEVSGLRVLIVDDVFTTGATLSECASALKASRARSAVALTFAVAVPKESGESALSSASDTDGR